MATVRFRLEPTKRKDESTILARFTIDRKQRFAISTGQRIAPKYWDNQLQQVRSHHPDHVSLNTILSRFKANLLTLWRDNIDMPFDEFKALAKGNTEKKSLYSLYPDFLAHVKRDYDYNTWKRYNSLWNHLQAIGPKETINQLKEGLETRLRNKGDGLRDSSISKYIVNLKTFFKWAEEKGFKVDPAYKKWKTIKRKNDPLSLTLQDLLSLEGCILLNTGAAIARDYLVVGARVGMRISDIKRISKSNLSQSEGIWYLTFNPKKGNRIENRTITIPLVGYMEPALRVLQKHNYSLPEMSEQKINKWIKKVCEKAGITEPITRSYWKGGVKISETKPKCEWITTHSGRKTFITLALEDGRSPKIVMDVAGIESWGTMKHYQAKAQAKTIKDEFLRDKTA